MLTTRCPDCAGALADTPGFAAWCPSCDWGLDPDAPATARGRLARRRTAASHRMVMALFEQLRGQPVARPGWDLARVAANAVAVLVHALTAGTFLAGAWLLVTTWFSWWLTPVGVGLLSVAWVLRPRLGRLDDEVVLTRTAAPALHDLLDRVAASVGTRPADVVVLDADFNASYGVVGWRRRHVLTLGLALWLTEDRQERVATLGHEFAHGVNGDARHGLLVGTAIDTMAGWAELLRPTPATDDPDEIRTGIDVMAEWIQRGLFTVLSGGVLALARAMELLVGRSSQRAEYLADEISARAAGTRAAVSALEKLLLEPGLFVRLRREAAYGISADRDLFDAVAAYVASVPVTERERLRRVARRRLHSVDSTHPPTALRMELLTTRPVTTSGESAAVVMTSAEADAILAELAPHRPVLHKRLRDALLDD